jgi:L-lactate dehydrogenase (cytochrome)
VLVITVDIPVPGRRARDYRSGLAGAPGLGGSLRRLAQALQRPRWSLEVGLGGRPLSLGNVASELGDRSGLQDFLGWTARNFDPSVTWRDLEFVRDAWDGPVVIKGILDPGDARDAVQFGADAVVVSNHGGRQLDGVSSTVRALGPVRDAVEGRATVLVDGGVRSGLDVFRMIASGAEGVLLGRMWVYALAAGGQAGVARMLELLREDLRVAMALTGARTIGEIGADLIEVR